MTDTIEYSTHTERERKTECGAGKKKESGAILITGVTVYLVPGRRKVQIPRTQRVGVGSRIVTVSSWQVNAV